MLCETRNVFISWILQEEKGRLFYFNPNSTSNTQPCAGYIDPEDFPYSNNTINKIIIYFYQHVQIFNHTPVTKTSTVQELSWKLKST